MKKIVGVLLAVALLTASMASCSSSDFSDNGAAACGDTSLVGLWIFDFEGSYKETSIDGEKAKIEPAEVKELVAWELYSNGTATEYTMPYPGYEGHSYLYEDTFTWYAENGTFVRDRTGYSYKLSGDKLEITSVDYDLSRYDDDEYSIMKERKMVTTFNKSKKTVYEWTHDEYLKCVNEAKK